MQEDYAFGQVTPFIGTKGWLSLKLWMTMLSHGRGGLAALAESRVNKARRFAALLDEHPHLVRLHDHRPCGSRFCLPAQRHPARSPSSRAADSADQCGETAHPRAMLAERTWYLHQFSLPDDHARLQAGATLYPLRFMATNGHHMAEVIDYVNKLGGDLEKDIR